MSDFFHTGPLVKSHIGWRCYLLPPTGERFRNGAPHRWGLTRRSAKRRAAYYAAHLNAWDQRTRW